jgi:tRNA (cmo5U34)-methyltransferase
MTVKTTKSSVDQIRQRFDNDVERFSNLETGQAATMDAPLMLELVSSAAAATTPGARSVLDVGCGAGNYTLKLLQKLPGLDVTLVDLSPKMVERAVERVSAATTGKVRPLVGDVREIALNDGSHNLILAAAVLHHLRTDQEWEAVFSRFYRCLRPGGSVWIADFITHDLPGVARMMWDRYGQYLESHGGPAYREKVFAYVEEEDTPKSLLFQTDLLKRVGFGRVEVLHKNNCFAAFGAVKDG